MLNYHQALAMIEQAGWDYPTRTQERETARLDGCVSAAKLAAPRNIQPFDNSAMDGFAVRLSDFPADMNEPLELHRRATLAAGDNAGTVQWGPGECVAIMTGAAVPPDTDAVVPVENTEENDGRVTFRARPEPGANIRRAGEDFGEGDIVWAAGERLGPAHVMAASTLGVPAARVYAPLRAAFIATGRELVDDFSEPLEPGQIYNSNRFYAQSVLPRLGLEPAGTWTIADNPEAFSARLRALMDDGVDIIISSGAVSAGEFDFIRAELEKLDAEILFHKLSIKPGKPNLFARLPNGSFFFGLPGNPVATVVGLRFFVIPFLDAAMGRAPEEPVRARLKNRVEKRSPLRIFLKACTRVNNGSLEVESLEGQASFRVAPLLRMNAWLVAPEECEVLEAGTMVDIYPLYPDSLFPGDAEQTE